MRSLMIAAAVTIVVGAGGVPAKAFTTADHGVVKVEASGVTLAGSSKRRPHYDVRVPRYRYHARVPPQYRGFEDPGYAYHGNINGCVVDLGYGRWEPCNGR
jgi:hypothetical protein